MTIRNAVFGLLGVMVGGATFHVERPPVPAQSIAQPIMRGSILEDVAGNRVSTVMTHADALIEGDRWNCKCYYHPNPALLPIGWVDVVVLRASDYVAMMRKQ